MAKKKNKFMRRLPLVGIFLLLVVGLGLFMYPIIGDWYSEYTSHFVIDSYNQAVGTTDKSTLVKIEKEAEAYNEAIAKNDSKTLSVTDYNSLLNVSTAMAYIEIPKIGVYLPIYKGLDDDTLQKGIGHMEGTSLPIGGKNTHCVLAGHTGLPSAKLFTDLDLLTTGDVFYIHVLDKVMKYQVDQIKTVLPSESQDIQIVDGEDYVTLLTCTPYGINSHRLLVRGTRIPSDTQTAENTHPWPVVHDSEEQIPARTLMWYGAAIVIGIVLLVIIIILIFPAHKRRKKKAEETNTDTIANSVTPTDENKEQ